MAAPAPHFARTHRLDEVWQRDFGLPLGALTLARIAGTGAGTRCIQRR